MSKSYYDILGVSKIATDDEIKKAYRKLAVEMHPDKHPGDKAAEDNFKKINEAYATLSNKEKRKLYDMQQAGPQPSADGSYSFTSNFNYSGDAVDDLINKFFKDRSSAYFNQKKSAVNNEENLNIKVKVSVTFEEAYTGCQKSISYNIKEKCSACDGNRYDKSSKCIKCPNCNGAGFTVEYVESFFGQRERKRVQCSHCNGTGFRHEKECSKCKGTGSTTKMKTIQINIPAGAAEGMELKAAKCGSQSKNGSVGDLYIIVSVPNISSDAKFKRLDGNDMETNISISYYELLCGSEKSVKLPNGSEKRFKIPTNMPLKTQLKLNGCGFPSLHKGSDPGNLLININLERLTNLTDEQKELLKKFDESIKR